MKTLAAILLVTFSSAAALAAASYAGNGVLGFYDAKGVGACGATLDASKEFVSVSAQHWTSANPNKDPLCSKNVQVTYNGKSYKLAIKDKCQACSANRLDLSKAAFLKFAGANAGTLSNASWSIVD